jgi:hypothetical protein
MAVKAYFSGVESEQHWQHCVDAKVTHCLMSFYQFMDKDRDIVKRRKLKYPHINFMIDSGAHTFRDPANMHKFASWGRKEFDNYAEDYAKWLRDNRKYVTAGVELDIESTLNEILAGNKNASIGLQIVESWQKNLFMPLHKVGLDMIYVWHSERRMEGWEEMCSKFDYVGLPGKRSSDPDFNKFMAVAKRYTTRVHGFAATKQIDFRDVPWYSIDSITWKSPEMWGVMLVWDERKQKFISEGDKSRRGKYREIIKAAGFDADKIIADTDYKLCTKYGLWSMRKMEKFYEDKYKDRTFYYELRLPHRDVIRKMGGSTLMQWWKLFRPDTLFQEFAQCSATQVSDILCSLSAVQNGDANYITAQTHAQDFLGKVFPKLVNPLVGDIRILQQELSNYISPRNPPPLERTEDFHYAPLIEFKRRDEPDFLSDLEFEEPGNHYLASVI